MQTGISFAVGQLLAVVAPKTVLVVDAPTDWSLAGPLWELALDDAPVDEILDVLIRRGIRTAPSFAIVRVENDAVRALVRGSVPVCFERAGEPVRLDATGATSWLEGLISGARRVLVGTVDPNMPLPYLVSTGVVLVSGLALPTGADVAGDGSTGRGGSREEPGSAADPSGDDSSSGGPGSGGPGEPASQPGGPSPVPVGASVPARVVDLTRSSGRPSPPPLASVPSGESADRGDSQQWPVSPRAEGQTELAELAQPAEALAEGRSEAAAALNGHAPTALAQPQLPEVVERPDEISDQPDIIEQPDEIADQPDQTADQPDELELEQAIQEPPIRPPDVSGFEAPGGFEERDPFAPPLDFEPASLSGYEDEPAQADPDEPALIDGPAQRTAEADSSDLLVDAEPVGPSPVDLPNFDPSSLSLPPLTRYTPEPTPRFVPRPPEFPGSESGAPAAWPPLGSGERANGSGSSSGWYGSFAPYDSPAQEADERSEDVADRLGTDDLAIGGSAKAADSPEPADALDPDDSPAVEDELDPGDSLEPADELDAGDELDAADEFYADDEFEADDEFDAEPDAEPVSELASESAADRASGPELTELPYRVRGQSLRPEQREPLRSPSEPYGYTPGDPPLIPPPDGIPSPSRPVTPAASGQPANASTNAPAHPRSGSLLLPAFFRGARAARSKPAEPSAPAVPPAPAAPAAREGGWPGPHGPSSPGSQGESSAPSDSGWPQPPSAWSPPMRRVFPLRSAPDGRPGATGLTGMPGALRPGNAPGGPATPPPGFGPDAEPGDAETHTPAGGSRAAEPPREPPRLLGVWCDAGHVTSPDRSECRVCGLPVPAQAPILVARPPLGVLVFDNGDRVVIDRPVILGRDPKVVSSPDPEVPVLHPVQSATGQVSRTHAEVRASGWDVVLTDLDAMNGTALTAPGASPVAIEPGVPTVLTSGSRVDLGGESGFVFEIEG